MRTKVRFFWFQNDRLNFSFVETKSCMSVSSYCISKLPNLITCHGMTLDRDQLTPVVLNEELMMERGRDSDPDPCLRLLNSSQYLYEYPPTQKIPLDQITSICLDSMGISDIQPLEALHQLKYVSLCNNNITSIAPLKSAVHLIEVHCNQNKLKAWFEILFIVKQLNVHM